jgi:hypothetical protein
MSTIEILLVQVAISLLVVSLYHLWTSHKRQPAPPNLNLTPDPLRAPRAPQPPSQAPVLAISATPAAAPPPAKTTPVPEQIPPEIIAVIAASIAAVLGRPHQVLSVEPATAQSPAINVWALEGRVEQFMSHKIR